MPVDSSSMYSITMSYDAVICLTGLLLVLHKTTSDTTAVL